MNIDMIDGSPIQDRGEKFRDQALVIGTELCGIARLVVFAIEVVWVEGADGSEDLVVLLVGEVRVCVFAMPGVEAVIADHRKTFCWECTLVLENVV